MTLKDASDLLSLEGASRQLSTATLEFYRARTRAIIKVIGDKRIDLVTSTDLRMVMAGSTAGSAPLNFSFLRRLFRFLIAEEVLIKNPMEKLQPPRIKSKVIQPLTAPELQLCFRAAKEQGGLLGARDAAIFATLVGTGLRRSELCNLKDEEVRIQEGVMLVHGKGGRERLVPIPINLKKMLMHYIYLRKDSRATVRSNRFFRDRNNTDLDPKNLTRLLTRLGEKVGVDLHPHKLRHTFATSLMSHEGADVLHLQAICGWSTLAMAQRYAKPTMLKMTRLVDNYSPMNDLK